ncbi:MAG TPA: hypothetical protein VF029_04350 [Actinomycetota bacterium]
MRRLAVLAIVLAAAAACDGEERAAPTGTPSTAPSPASPAPSGTITTAPSPASPTPSGSPRPIPPAWALPIEEDVPPGELPDGALVPPGAELTSRVELSAGGGLPDQVAVAYAVGEDPFAREHGFAIWERFPEPPAWSVVYAFVDPPRRGVLGIRLQVGDLTGDGHDDLLVFEETGGSGACGTWRVVAASPDDTGTAFRRKTCDAGFRIRGGALELREAVYEPDDPHCCPSAFRYATYEWNGDRFVETASRLEPADAA